LINFGSEETWKLSSKLLDEGLKTGIFQDLSPNIGEISDKEFELGVSRHSTRALTRGINRKYMEFYTKEKAEENAIEEFRKKIAKEFKTLEEF